MSLAIDMTPLFTAINTWFPALFGIIAIGGGIAIALKLGQFLINSVSKAFI
jgi:hypothetical protein